MLFYDILAILIIIFIDVIKKFTCNNNIVKDFIFHWNKEPEKLEHYLAIYIFGFYNDDIWYFIG